MKLGYYMTIILPVTLAIGVAQAATPTPVFLAPGSYVASIMPTINHDMAVRIENSLKKVPGIESVTTRTNDSSVHFKVQDDNQVNLSELQKTLKETNAEAVMSAPILEHSLNANPGL